MVNVEIKLENMDKSAQLQTPVQNIHFIDLTFDSLGGFYKNLGSRQDNCSQWMYLLTYHLETTTLTDLGILYECEWQAKATLDDNSSSCVLMADLVFIYIYWWGFLALIF